MSEIRAYLWIAMAVAFIVPDSIAETVNADSLAFRLRNVLGEEMADDSLVNRLKNDVLKLQELVEKSSDKPIAWKLGLAEGYRNLFIVYLDESDKLLARKDSAGEASIRNKIEYSRSQMNKYMLESWAADSNNIEVLRQFLVINQDNDKDIQIFNRLMAHSNVSPKDKKHYLGFLDNIQDTVQVLALASKCEKDTAGISTNPVVSSYILFCAETLARFQKPKSAIRLYILLAKADPTEFKSIADKAIPRLKAAAKK